MAITSYAELQTAIANWTDRTGQTDFITRVPEFISLAENRLNRIAPVRLSETDASLTGTADSRSVALPSDFLEPIALFLTTFGTQDRLAPVVAGTYALSTTSGTPSAWMINGSNIDLDCPCDQAHTFSFRYRKKLFDLATTDPNWLLTNFPDVYLYESLFHAYAFMQEAQTASGYRALADQAITEVTWLESRAKAVAPMRVDAALVATGGFNINSGDCR